MRPRRSLCVATANSDKGLFQCSAGLEGQLLAVGRINDLGDGTAAILFDHAIGGVKNQGDTIDAGGIAASVPDR